MAHPRCHPGSRSSRRSVHGATFRISLCRRSRRKQRTVSSNGAVGGFRVRTTSALLISARLLVNGVTVNGSAVSPTTAESALCRTAIAEASAGSTVNVQLYGLLGASTLINPGGAELVIERFSDIKP